MTGRSGLTRRHGSLSYETGYDFVFGVVSAIFVGGIDGVCTYLLNIPNYTSIFLLVARYFCKVLVGNYFHLPVLYHAR